MTTHESSYYPPRRTWWRRWVVNPLTGARREWLGAWVERQVGLPLLSSLAALLLPGYALGVLPWPRIRIGWWAAYSICFLIAMAWLGHGVSGLALGLMVGLHVSAVLALLSRIGVRPVCWAALWTPILLLGGVALSVYWPLARLVSDRLFMAVRTPRGVVVIHCASRSTVVQRGELVAYRIQGRDGLWSQPGLLVHTGLGVGRVLAVEGDRVEFGLEHFWIDGVAFPRVGNMPVRGELVVRKGHWFIWPEVRQQGENVRPEVVSDALLRIASVPCSELVGKPFTRWFGRRQPVL